MKSKLTTYLFLLVLLFGYTMSHGQSTYSGTLLDASDQEPLIGATVLLEGTSIGTTTDLDGTFSIVASPGDKLIFSFLGYVSEAIVLDNNTSLNVSLQPDNNLLDEIVVIGYGTIKKSDLTGSVSSVKSEDITKAPSIDAMQALQGKVAGLQILSTNGDPGASPVVRLRGITTLNNNNPIAVIDGVISDISSVSLLNPNDIESMEVLKDASATAIYGSRGAAGVIIVTTKRGVAGENRVNISIERGIESVANKIGVMDGREFATYINGINPGTYNNLDALDNTDWQDLIYQDNAPITNANFSVSGGSEKNNFYFGLGYYGQEGVLPKSDLKRLSGKLNSSYKVTNSLTLGLDLTVSVRDKNNAPGVVNTALRAWPIDSPFLEDGVTYADVNGGNALAAIEYTNSNTDRVEGLGNLYAEFSFLNDFRFKSSLQFTSGENKTKSFGPTYFVGPLQQNEINDLSYGVNSETTIISENTLTYNKSFDKHGLTALVGYTTQDTRGEGINGFTEGLIREDPLFWYLDAGQNDFERVSNSGYRQTLLSYLGRINYTFDSRYLFTASLRRDGSSKFGPNNKYGNFFSFATGWNISNESFFPQDGPINAMKLRASYGTIGNERINGNAQYSLINGSQDAVFGVDENIQAGASFDGGGNPDLKWESTSQFNVGIDIGLYDDRLTAEIDYYQKKSSDILVPLEPIGYSGIGSFRSIVFNAADVSNSGIEWNVNYRNSSKAIRYSIGITGSTISNEVTNIGQGFGADSLLVGGDLGNGQQVTRTAVGFPIGFFYGYEVEGVFQDEAEIASNPSLFGASPGDLRFRDVNNDGALNGDDRTIIGSSIPSLIYGLNTEIGYKNFTLGAEFQGQLGNEIYNGKQAIRFTTLNYEDKFNDNWTGPGSTNTDPRPSEGGNNFLPSSYFVEDGSFIRLRTLTLGYELPNRLIDKVKMEGVNVYIRATNLFTATSFTGYSPEIGSSNAIGGVIDRGLYPITRVITLGLNANF